MRKYFRAAVFFRENNSVFSVQIQRYFEAAAKGNPVSMRFLLKMGCNPNKPDAYSYTPLMIATGNKNYKCAELLVKHPDINVNGTSRSGISPLHQLGFFSQTHETGMLKLLLSHQDINVNIQDRDGWTPLMLFCQKDLYKHVKILLQSPNIKPDLEDHEGYKALYFCDSDSESIKVLLGN